MPDADPRFARFNPNPISPTLRLPAGSCDTHTHVYGDPTRFSYDAGRPPKVAPKEALFGMHRKMGITRCVVVQSVAHGFDNRVVEDVIDAGGGRYLGVALLPSFVPDAELRRLASRGFRGVRFNFMRLTPGLGEIDDMITFTRRLGDVDMHLQVHIAPDLLHAFAEPLTRSAVPVVIDHMGRVDARLGPDHAHFRTVFDLMRDPKFHVKVCGIDRVDWEPAAAPRYERGVALARKLVEAYPERCFWGTDWPHPSHTHMPDDGLLVDALERIAPTQEHLHQLLVANPQRFYRFAP